MKNFSNYTQDLALLAIPPPLLVSDLNMYNIQNIIGKPLAFDEVRQ